MEQSPIMPFLVAQMWLIGAVSSKTDIVVGHVGGRSIASFPRYQNKSDINHYLHLFELLASIVDLSWLDHKILLFGPDLCHPGGDKSLVINRKAFKNRITNSGEFTTISTVQSTKFPKVAEI